MKSFSVSVCERVEMRAVPILAMITDHWVYSDQATAGAPGEYTCYLSHLTLEATQNSDR